MLDLLPTDLSLGRLGTPWAYWLLLVCLLAEALWMAQRLRQFWAHVPENPDAKGPWDTPDEQPDTPATWAITADLLISCATILALVLGSAAAFYIAALGLVPAARQLIAQWPYAVGGQAVGTVIGSFIGEVVQVGVIMAAIVYFDANIVNATPN